MLLFTKRKLFQTNQYSQVSLIISALKKNHIDFQVKENDINARYGIFGMDKAASTYIPRKANTIYSIYVRRKNYDTALLLLHSSIHKQLNTPTFNIISKKTN